MNLFDISQTLIIIVMRWGRLKYDRSRDQILRLRHWLQLYMYKRCIKSFVYPLYVQWPDQKAVTVPQSQ